MLAMSPSKAAASVAWMREAELKHARLAMLAVAGWPLSELASGPLLQALGTNGRAPSLLNGALFGFQRKVAHACLVLLVALDQVHITNSLSLLGLVTESDLMALLLPFFIRTLRILALLITPSPLEFGRPLAFAAYFIRLPWNLVA